MKKCKCGSTNITHEEKTGRGLPPKNYNPPVGIAITRKISWKGIWDVYTCDDCDNIVKKLRR